MFTPGIVFRFGWLRARPRRERSRPRAQPCLRPRDRSAAAPQRARTRRPPCARTRTRRPQSPASSCAPRTPPRAGPTSTRARGRPSGAQRRTRSEHVFHRKMTSRGVTRLIEHTSNGMEIMLLIHNHCKALWQTLCGWTDPWTDLCPCSGPVWWKSHAYSHLWWAMPSSPLY